MHCSQRALAFVIPPRGRVSLCGGLRHELLRQPRQEANDGVRNPTDDVNRSLRLCCRLPEGFGSESEAMGVRRIIDTSEKVRIEHDGPFRRSLWGTHLR